VTSAFFRGYFQAPLISNERKMANSFVPSKAHDFTIQNEQGVIVGHFRLRPASILWREPEGKRWYRVKLVEFITLAREMNDQVDS
jgi:hypothetical protein